MAAVATTSTVRSHAFPPTSATEFSRLAEVRDAVFSQLKQTNQGRNDGGKLINELGWRDFWQRMWLDLGDRIDDDQEESQNRPCRQ